MRNTLRLVGMTALAAGLPLFAFAAPTQCIIVDVLVRITRIFGSIVIIVSVLMLLYAAFLFITGGGNEEKIKSARMTLVWALVGIAVALLAQFGVPFVRDLISQGVGIFSSECGTQTPQ